MTYLIMECAAGYAVALDENGRFLKVPNLGYEVGQRVDDVVVFEGGPYGEAEVLPFGEYRARRTRGRRLALVAAAACLMLLVVATDAAWPPAAAPSCSTAFFSVSAMPASPRLAGHRSMRHRLPVNP